ncbi:hypothetical protein CC2G_007915 [Coprinopsis cinerea AmutBmut pab1-1]|nr:hypothetical protein CC2G_007915 [Coprinopsis cinerea AmutBmut pab1-1]
MITPYDWPPSTSTSVDPLTNRRLLQPLLLPISTTITGSTSASHINPEDLDVLHEHGEPTSKRKLNLDCWTSSGWRSMTGGSLGPRAVDGFGPPRVRYLPFPLGSLALLPTQHNLRTPLVFNSRIYDQDPTISGYGR